MKRLVFLLASSCAFAGAADLSGVRNVYVFPMSRGLDQYLASHLTSRGVFQVVTDPKLADAVLSDQFGQSLQTQLEALFPTPKDDAEEAKPAESKPAEPKPADSKDAKTAASRKADTMAGDTQSPLSAFSATNKADNPAPLSVFGRGRGTIFLVDAKSRQVLWSTYDPPKSTAARELNRAASSIVSRISKDLKKQK